MHDLLRKMGSPTTELVSDNHPYVLDVCRVVLALVRLNSVANFTGRSGAYDDFDIAIATATLKKLGLHPGPINYAH